MLKGILAKAGFGSAKIDTIIENEHLMQGANVKGHIHVKGGTVAQDINKIRLSVMTLAKQGDVARGVPIDSYAIDFKKNLQPGEEVNIPFEFPLPDETPITTFQTHSNQSYVWIETELDIEFGLDSTDKDYLAIYPHPAVEKLVNRMQHHGFVPMKADVEVGFLRAGNFQSHSGIYQEVEFKPQVGFGNMRFSIQEVELSFVMAPDRIHLLVEIDRAFIGDGYRAMSFSPNISEQEADQIIQQMMG